MYNTNMGLIKSARNAALAFMLSIILMDLSYVVLLLAAPPQLWSGVVHYSQTFRVISMLPIVVGLMVVTAYVHLCRCWRALSDGVVKAWSRVGEGLSYLFCFLSGSAYLVQLLIVLPRVKSGRLEGLEALIFANDRSLTWALNNWGWFFLGISAFCFAHNLAWSGWDLAIKLLLWVYAASSVLLLFGYVLSNLPLQLPMVICWFTVQPLAYALLVIKFNRLLKHTV